MTRFLSISPAIVALFIFIYFNRVHLKRKYKLRKRIWRKEKDVRDILSQKKKIDINEN
jgi:hypothetical protein